MKQLQRRETCHGYQPQMMKMKVPLGLLAAHESTATGNTAQ